MTNMLRNRFKHVEKLTKKHIKTLQETYYEICKNMLRNMFKHIEKHGETCFKMCNSFPTSLKEWKTFASYF